MSERFRLATARLHLRPVRSGDVDALHALWTHADVRRWLWDDVVIDRETAADRVATSHASFARAGYGHWIVSADPAGALLGGVGLVEIDPAVGPELLYAFHPSHWGRGYATEASRAVLAHGFGRCGLERVMGRTDAPNRASARVLERLGMRFEGESAPGGRPTRCYALSRVDFEEAVPDRGPLR